MCRRMYTLIMVMYTMFSFLKSNLEEGNVYTTRESEIQSFQPYSEPPIGGVHPRKKYNYNCTKKCIIVHFAVNRIQLWCFPFGGTVESTPLPVIRFLLNLSMESPHFLLYCLSLFFSFSCPYYKPKIVNFQWD